MEKQDNIAAKLFDRIMHIWTVLEDIAGRTKDDVGAQTRETCTDGTPPRVSNINDHVVGERKEEYGIDSSGMSIHSLGGSHNAELRSTYKKGHAGPNMRKGTCRKVPQSRRRCQGSAQFLRGLG